MGARRREVISKRSRQLSSVILTMTSAGIYMYYGLSRCWGTVTSFKGAVDYAGNSNAGDFFKLSGLQILWGHDRHNSFWNSWANNFVSFKDMFLKAAIHVSSNILH